MVEGATRVEGEYRTTLDRAGLALAVGGALGGLVITLLMLAGGVRDPLRLTVALVLGGLSCTVAITLLGAPLWLALHRAGCRRAWQAGLLGAAVAMILFVAAQMLGTDAAVQGAALTYRWLSALASAALIAIVAAAIAVTMWRVAYRPG